eukprot:INCI14198.1.p1 GENE.INCI14198.1~~INCI14198.1.p1  ORF type:complete len:368 (+),score=74.19 INCI14198.1:125-1228(+)
MSGTNTREDQGAAAVVLEEEADDDDVSDLHSTRFMGTNLVVRNTSTGDDPEDGFRTGGWMWPASFVILRFLEDLLWRSVNKNEDESEVVGPEDSELARAVEVREWMALPWQMPRSFLDFSAGPGLIGIAAAVALGSIARPGEVEEEEETSASNTSSGSDGKIRNTKAVDIHITDFGQAQLDLIRDNCRLNHVHAVASELRWGDSAAGMSGFPTLGDPENEEEIATKHSHGKDSNCPDQAQGSGRNASAVIGSSSCQQRRFFDLVICSDCLFIACRDELREEFVETLLSLIGPSTVVLLGYTPRRPDEPDLLRILETQGGLEVREVPQELLDFRDLSADLEEVGMFASMFHIVPKVKLYRLARRQAAN